MFVVSVVYCQVEVSATSWSLVQRSPTDCGEKKNCSVSTCTSQIKECIIQSHKEWLAAPLLRLHFVSLLSCSS